MRIAAILISALAVAAPGVASASDDAIVPRRSIGPVRVNMTVADLRARLGEPDATRPSDLHGGWTLWIYRDEGLQVTVYDQDRVWDVRTGSRRYRTKRGAGVGTRLRALKRDVSGLNCRSYGGPHPDWIACDDISKPFQPFTQFLLAHRRVFRVTVARGLAV